MATSATRIVRVVLEVDDKGSARVLQNAGRAADKTRSQFERMQSVGRGMSSVGRAMTAMALPVAAVGGYAVKTAASFQSSMEMIRTQAGASQKQVEMMSKAVQNMAPQVGTGPQELSAGLYHLESQGLRSGKALSALRVAAQGAAIGHANLEDVTNALGAAITTGLVPMGHYSQAMGQMNAIVGSGDMHMQDLADAFSTNLPAAMNTYGVSLQSAGAALAVFGDANQRGAEAGTRLASAIRIMAAPSATASKALSIIGLNATQLATDMHRPGGLVTAIADLRQHLQDSGLTAEQQGLVITRAFGGRQAGGVELLLDHLDRLRRKFQDVGKGATSFSGDWNETTKTIAFQWSRMRATIEVSLIKLGNALMPIVTRMLPPFISGLSKVAGWISHLPKPILDVVVGLTAFLAIGGPTLIFLGRLVEGIAVVGKAMQAMKIMTLATSTVMKASLIGFAVFALIELVTHFSEVKRIAGEVFNGMSIAAKAVGHAISSVFTGIWHVVEWALTKIIALWKNSPLGGAVGAVGNLARGNLMGAGRSLLHGATFGLLHTGGPVKPKYFDMGGPVGTDTIPGWLSPGEFVLNRATTARIGVPALERLNAGGMGGGGSVNVTITPLPINLDGRPIAQAVLRATVNRGARGASTLAGGGLMVGSA